MAWANAVEWAEGTAECRERLKAALQRYDAGLLPYVALRRVYRQLECAQRWGAARGWGAPPVPIISVGDTGDAAGGAPDATGDNDACRPSPPSDRATVKMLAWMVGEYARAARMMRDTDPAVL